MTQRVCACGPCSSLASSPGVNNLRGFRVFSPMYAKCSQIWNQPVTAYNCRKQDLGTTRVLLTCTIRYVMETQPTWDRHVAHNLTESYRFAVELENGEPHMSPLLEHPNTEATNKTSTNETRPAKNRQGLSGLL